MKRVIGILVVAVLLALPLCAGATYLGNGVLNVVPSSPVEANYYLDYDGTVKSSTFEYTTGLVEIFCVSSENANSFKDTAYSFYTITSDLSNYAKLSKAAWIADNWTNYGGTSDYYKAEAQKAVWAIMGVMNIMEFTGLDKKIYADAMLQNNYVTNNWIFAQSPVVGVGGLDYQDYLTPYSPPTQAPEPATMLLFGRGLLGLAGVRRKIKK